MAKLVNLKNGGVDLKFPGAHIRKFNRVSLCMYKTIRIRIQSDRNDAVYEIFIRGERHLPLFNQLKGQPTEIVMNKIIAHIDYDSNL